MLGTARADAVPTHQAVAGEDGKNRAIIPQTALVAHLGMATESHGVGRLADSRADGKGRSPYVSWRSECEGFAPDLICGTMQAMDEDEGFWRQLDELVRGHDLVIEREKGSFHPRYCACVYPLDYGYLCGTRSGDGGQVDVWVGDLDGHQVTGLICTVDTTKSDVEIKILLGCSREEADQALAFHNRGQQQGVLILRC